MSPETGALTEVERAFLRELSALSRKYRIAIEGCGCWGSPFLTAITDDAPPAGYGMADGAIRWISPTDKYDWERYQSTIVR